ADAADRCRIHAEMERLPVLLHRSQRSHQRHQRRQLLLRRHRQPPRFPLFPYTTLFRSSPGQIARTLRTAFDPYCRTELAALEARSEEHTSELQSLAYLVCRLLLEKKKKNKKNRSHHLNNKAN